MYPTNSAELAKVLNAAPGANSSSVYSAETGLYLSKREEVGFFACLLKSGPTRERVRRGAPLGRTCYEAHEGGTEVTGW